LLIVLIKFKKEMDKLGKVS